MFEIEFGKFEGFVYKERRPLNSITCNNGINDSPFIVAPTITGKRVSHPAYSTWKNMLERCYNSKYKERHPTYIGVTCCEDWLLFTTFARWFKDNYVSGYHLDKDLLIRNNKVYSPNTCIFATKDINNFLTLGGAVRGELPLGVYLNHGGYISQINNGKSQKYLGRFKSKEEAHQAWQRAKLEQAIAFNFPPLQRVIDQLTYDIDNNLETKTL